MNERLKEKLVLNRLDKVYCRLAPSNIHGVGVHAIRIIPKGVNPFKDSYMAQDSILINKSKVTSEVIQSLLNDYHPSDSNKDFIISTFPNQLIWTNYINYSDTPNIELKTNGEWETLKQIEVGEELLENPKIFFNVDGTRKIYNVNKSQYPMVSYTN